MFFYLDLSVLLPINTRQGLREQGIHGFVDQWCRFAIVPLRPVRPMHQLHTALDAQPSRLSRTSPLVGRMLAMILTSPPHFSQAVQANR
jgi:hypothetical protein